MFLWLSIIFHFNCQLQKDLFPRNKRFVRVATRDYLKLTKRRILDRMFFKKKNNYYGFLFHHYFFFLSTSGKVWFLTIRRFSQMFAIVGLKYLFEVNTKTLMNGKTRNWHSCKNTVIKKNRMFRVLNVKISLNYSLIFLKGVSHFKCHLN